MFHKYKYNQCGVSIPPTHTKLYEVRWMDACIMHHASCIISAKLKLLFKHLHCPNHVSLVRIPMQL